MGGKHRCLIAEKDAVLDTCHLSARECWYLIDAARDAGVRKIIVTHPNCSVNLMTIGEQKELADKGAYLSYAFLPCMPFFDRQHPITIAMSSWGTTGTSSRNIWARYTPNAA